MKMVSTAASAVIGGKYLTEDAKDALVREREEAKALAGELASMLKDVETFPEANEKKSPKELIMEIISQDSQDFHHAELNASSAVKHLHEFLKRRPE